MSTTTLSNYQDTLPDRIRAAIASPVEHIESLGGLLREITAADGDAAVVRAMASHTSDFTRGILKVVPSFFIVHIDSTLIPERLAKLRCASEALFVTTLYFSLTTKDFQHLFRHFRTFFLQNLPRIHLAKDAYIAFTFAVCAALTNGQKASAGGIVDNPLIGNLSMHFLSTTVGTQKVSDIDIVNALFDEVESAQLEPVAEDFANQLLHVLSACIALFEGKKPERRDVCLDQLLAAIAPSAPACAIIPKCTNAHVFESLREFLNSTKVDRSLRIPHAKFVHAFMHDVFTSMPQVLYKAFEIDNKLYENIAESGRSVPSRNASLVPAFISSLQRPFHEFPKAGRNDPIASTMTLLQLCLDAHRALCNHYSFPSEGVHFASINKGIRDYLQKYILFFIEECLLSDSPACVAYGTDMLAQYYFFLSQCIRDATTAAEILEFVQSFQSKMNILSVENVRNNIAHESLPQSNSPPIASHQKVNFLAKARVMGQTQRSDTDGCAEAPSSAVLLCMGFLRLFEVLSIYLPAQSPRSDFVRQMGLEDISIRFLAFSVDDYVIHSAFTLLAAFARTPLVAHRIFQKLTDLRLLQQDSIASGHVTQLGAHVSETSLRGIYADFAAELKASSFLRTTGYLAVLRWMLLAGYRTQTFSFIQQSDAHGDAPQQWDSIIQHQVFCMNFCKHVLSAIHRDFIQSAKLNDGMWTIVTLCCEILREGVLSHEKNPDWHVLLKEVEPFMLVFTKNTAVSSNAERGIRSILTLLHGVLQVTDSPMTHRAIVSEFTRNSEFRSRLMYLFQARSPSLHEAASKCFFQLTAAKRDESELVGQWYTEGVANEIAEILRSAIFSRPKFAYPVDELHYLSRSSHDEFHDTPIENEMQTKIDTLRALLRMCESGGTAISRLVFGYQQATNRSIFPLQAVMKRVSDMFMRQHCPVYHAACAEALYVLLSDPNVSHDEIRSVREEGVTNVVNELWAHDILHPRQTGWYLHLCSFFVQSELISPQSVPNLCDHIVQIATSIPQLSAEHMRYLHVNPSSGKVSYDIPALDSTVLFQHRSQFPGDFIETLESQNVVIDQSEMLLIVLRGWALLVEAVIHRDKAILSNRELIVQHLSSLWECTNSLSRAFDRLPLSGETRIALAEALYAFLSQMMQYGGLMALGNEERNAVLGKIVNSISQCPMYPTAQTAMIRCLILFAQDGDEKLSTDVITNTPTLFTALEKAITGEAKGSIELSCIAFDALTFLVEHPAVRDHALTGTNFKRIVNFAFPASDDGISSLFLAAINGQVSAAVGSPQVDKNRRRLTSLLILCDAIAKSMPTIEKLFEIAIFERIAASRTVAVLRQRSFITLVEKDLEVRQLVVSMLRPILRLFINTGYILEKPVITSTVMSMVNTMTKLKEVAAVFLTKGDGVLDDGSTTDSKTSLHPEIVSVYYYIVQFGFGSKELRSIIDSDAIEAFIYILVDSPQPLHQHLEVFAPLSLQLVRVVRGLLGPLQRTHDDTLPFELLYVLLCLAQRQIAVMRKVSRENTQFSLQNQESLLEMLLESLSDAVHVVAALVNDHPKLSVKDLHTFTTLLDRKDVHVPLEAPLGRYVFQGNAFNEKEKFAYIWRVTYDFCQQCKGKAVFDRDFSRQAAKTAFLMRTTFEAIIERFESCMQRSMDSPRQMAIQ